MNGKTAIIDIGSNSVRLGIVDPQQKLNKKYVETTRLGEGLDSTGGLLPANMDKTAQAVKNFINIAKQQNISDIFIFATEAARAAKNGSVFTELVFDICGYTVDVVSGKQEALLGFLGAAGNSKKSCGILDIGGASAELTAGQSGVPKLCVSLPIGLLRLKERYGADYSALKQALPALLSTLDNFPKTEVFYGISGTATSLASMLLNQKAYNPEAVHLYSLTTDNLQKLSEEILSLDTAALTTRYPTLSIKRAEIIGYGIILTIAIMEKLQLKELTVSERDNIEGYYTIKTQS